MQLVIEPDGTVRFIYSETIDVSTLGSPTISRASYVEPDQHGRWLADLSPVGGPIEGPFNSRSEALLAEQARYPQRQVRKHLQLPKLWAAFRPADVANITGDGPELAAYASRTGRHPQRLLEHLRRDHGGRALHPLAWVSHHWRQAVAVFADLARFPKRQVFRLGKLPDDLVGYQDATEYDFHESRFRATDEHKHRVVPNQVAGGRVAVTI